ncbi:hypothetical protein [Methylocella sp.]|uniref:hypothetical protein n=1 Tax=Methylocella sp. TaxID=1978226 RepID=UPI003783D742
MTLQIADEDEIIEIAVNAAAGFGDEFRAAMQISASVLHMAALIRDFPEAADADLEAANLNFNRALAARLKQVKAAAGGAGLGRA